MPVISPGIPPAATSTVTLRMRLAVLSGQLVSVAVRVKTNVPGVVVPLLDMTLLSPSTVETAKPVAPPV